MNLKNISDSDLVSRFSNLLVEEKEALVLQLEYLLELDRRKLIFQYSSLWSYLVQEHGMEESTAERRIRAARLMKRFPFIKDALQSGKLNLSLLEIAQSTCSREKLSDEEFTEVLGRISGISCKKAKRELASMYPETVGIPRDQIRPLTDKLSEVRFVCPQELLDKLEEIRGLLAHSHPGATLAELIDVLATEYRKRHHPEEKAKRAESTQKILHLL